MRVHGIFILSLVTIATCQLSLRGDQECGDNQDFKTCGSACEPSCDNRSPSFCTLQCVVGCQCISGFVRDSNKNCIPPTDCNKVNVTVAPVAASTIPPVPIAVSVPAPVAVPDLPATCAVLDCIQGMYCTETTGTASCIPDPCANCTGESYCDTVTRTCVNPCMTMRCTSETTCRLQQVECIMEPCNPVAACVANNETMVDSGCAAVSCLIGSTCQMRQMECLTPPCNPVPVCVPNNETVEDSSCAAVSCLEGSTCQLKQVECVMAPCPPIPICVGNNETVEDAPVPTESIDTNPVTTDNAGTPVKQTVCKKKNEEFTTCHSPCNETLCPGMPPVYYCPKSCSEGCQCKEGFLRSADGNCYKEDQCQDAQCAGLKNEEWGCVDCEPTCDSNKTCDTANCVKGCTCHKGFTRINGTCVPFNLCPDEDFANVTCSGAEVYTDCLPACEGTCHGVQQCSEMALAVCKPGCTCKPNYKRDSFGECKHVKQCHKSTVCADNEIYAKCLPEEAKCSSSGGKVMHTKFKKCFSGCACTSGYARTQSGDCVPEANC